MRMLIAAVTLVAFAWPGLAGAECPGMQTAGDRPVIASTDGTPLPQTPVRVPGSGDRRG